MIKRYNAYGPMEDYNGDPVNYYDILPILKAAREVADELLLAHGWKEYRDCDCPKCKLARQIIEQTEGV